MNWRDRMKKQDLEPHTFNTFNPLYGADGEGGTDKKYNAHKKYNNRKTQTLKTIPAPEPPGMGAEYETATMGAWMPWESSGTSTAPNQCPARCKRSGKCYGIAFFEGKPGKAKDCEPETCKQFQKLIKTMNIEGVKR